MNSRFQKIIGHINKVIAFRPNEQFYISLVCIILASLFWTLITFNKNYSSFVRFPVKYIHLPDDKIVIKPLPEYISLEINAYGFAMLANQLSKQDTLIIDVNMLPSQKYWKDEFTAFIPIRTLMEDISNHLKAGVKLLKIPADTIHFNFEEKISKLVKVKLNASLSFEKQYILSNEIEVIPAAVKIFAPQSILDTLQSISTEKISYKNLNKSITQKVGFVLSQKHKNVKIFPSQSLIKIDVEKFTEGNINVPISITNLPESLSMKTFPDSINITYLVALSNYEKVNYKMFNFIVDYLDITNIRSSKLKVSLLQSPSFIELVRFSPNKVEYIISEAPTK